MCDYTEAGFALRGECEMPKKLLLSGLSVVRLLARRGQVLEIEGVDVLD
jgi:hypothetical protein